MLKNVLFFFIEYYFQQVSVPVLNIHFLPDAGENFIIFVNGILLFVHQLFAYIIAETPVQSCGPANSAASTPGLCFPQAIQGTRKQFLFFAPFSV